VVAAVGLLAAGALSACGTNMEAQTNAIYDAGPGVNVRGGGVDVLNALVVSNPDGTGTLSVALVNQADEADEVTSVEISSEGEPVNVQTEGLPLELAPSPPNPVQLDDEAPVYVEEAETGLVLTLTMTFKNGEPVEAEVPVVQRGDDPSNKTYESVPTAPAAEAEPAS
jgi:hypothetical protein